MKTVSPSHPKAMQVGTFGLLPVFRKCHLLLVLADNLQQQWFRHLDRRCMCSVHNYAATLGAHSETLGAQV